MSLFNEYAFQANHSGTHHDDYPFMTTRSNIYDDETLPWPRGLLYVGDTIQSFASYGQGRFVLSHVIYAGLQHDSKKLSCWLVERLPSKPEMIEESVQTAVHDRSINPGWTRYGYYKHPTRTQQFHEVFQPTGRPNAPWFAVRKMVDETASEAKVHVWVEKYRDDKYDEKLEKGKRERMKEIKEDVRVAGSRPALRQSSRNYGAIAGLREPRQAIRSGDLTGSGNVDTAMRRNSLPDSNAMNVRNLHGSSHLTGASSHGAMNARLSPLRIAVKAEDDEGPPSLSLFVGERGDSTLYTIDPPGTSNFDGNMGVTSSSEPGASVGVDTQKPQPKYPSTSSVSAELETTSKLTTEERTCENVQNFEHSTNKAWSGSVGHRRKRGYRTSFMGGPRRERTITPGNSWETLITFTSDDSEDVDIVKKAKKIKTSSDTGPCFRSASSACSPPSSIASSTSLFK